ncbi:TrbM/KikA/MpfK family conjugal transfer protein [Gilliamella sp. CG13]|uniref:TrbM/KikA/MpfK family conjugal transfer protein n=1 Tax=Gilliamella sp. CG13 TaxID=3351502 RepID=UPI0039860202
MKKINYFKTIIILTAFFSLNSFADEKEDLDRYRFEYKTIMSKEHISPTDQLKASDLKEKIQLIEKNNPSLKEDDRSIIDRLAETKESKIVTSSSPANTNDINYRENVGISDNLTHFTNDKKNRFNINQKDLSNDQALACGVILCLSSVTRPSECTSYLKKFFSIKVITRGIFNWTKTLTARKSFLAMCPVDNDDQNLNNLVNDIIPNQKTDCTADELNNLQDKKGDSIRTIAKLPDYCEALANHAYSDIKLPTYHCDGTYYSNKDWRRGYSAIIIRGKNPKKEYDAWKSQGNKGHMAKINFGYGYFKHYPITKKCWKDEN